MERPYKGKLLDKSTKWMDPTRIENFDSLQNGRTQQRLITYLVHKMDGSDKGKLLDKSPKWTDPTRVENFESTKWTDPTRVYHLLSPQNGRTLQK